MLNSDTSGLDLVAAPRLCVSLRSPTHVVVIPSYNTGAQVLRTVEAARAVWAPVWIVLDGSTDGTPDALRALADSDAGLRVVVLSQNRGKGAAVRHGCAIAATEGFTHALVMDADGQHPAAQIQRFMAESQANPDAMILGSPEFGPEAPALRVRGRAISNWWVQLETLWAGIGDSLFGFRVYPIRPLLEVMQRTRWMRRFDFDAEAVVRLSWAGVRTVNLRAPVRYLAPSEGGISHFRYGRDNILLTWMHFRLMLGLLVRLPFLTWRRAWAPARQLPSTRPL